MSITVASNLSAIKAQRQLSKATEAVSQSYSRLASGIRINSSSSDAAGLAIASSLRSDARIFAQGMRNISDGLSLLNVSEGALRELSSITMRQMELAEQASNGSYSATQRRVMNSEVNALVDEFNRIIQSTTFNGRQVFSSTNNSLQIQVGTNSSSSSHITTNLAEELSRTVGTGTFQAGVSFVGDVGGTDFSVTAADLNKDGITDIVTTNSAYLSIGIFIGNGDGSFLARTTYTAKLGAQEARVYDFNKDGNLDIVVGEYTAGTVSLYLGNGNGTFQASTSNWIAASNGAQGIELGDFNNDGNMDVAFGDFGHTSGGVLLGNSDGSFKLRTTFISGTQPKDIAVADLDGDGLLDILVTDVSGTQAVSFFKGNGDGTFKARVSYVVGSTLSSVSVGDFNGDGYQDFVAGGSTNAIVYLGNGNGTFASSVTYTVGTSINVTTTGDVNGDGYLDIISGESTGGVSVLLGNGNGTFAAAKTFTFGSTHQGIVLADFNRDSVLDIGTSDSGSSGLDIFTAVTTAASTIARIDLYSQSSARDALSVLTAQLERINLELGSIGSTQSRLGFASNLTAISKESYLAAESRIMDVDFAEETSNLIADQIRQQAASAILGQANQQPKLVLRLLQ